MPIYKKRPVEPLTVPEVKTEKQPVWYIKASGDIFTQYADYLNRLIFFNEPQFSCARTGRKDLNYYDALQSENEIARKLQEDFPEPWIVPALKLISFHVGSLQTLVDKLYDYFSENIFLNEVVHHLREDGKAPLVKIIEILAPNEHFLVQLVDRNHRPLTAQHVEAGEELEFDIKKHEVKRDRLVLSKSGFKHFIKEVAEKDTYFTAPWILRPEIIKKYNFEIEITEDIRVMLDEREKRGGKKRKLDNDSSTTSVNDVNETEKVKKEVKFPIEDTELWKYTDTNFVGTRKGWPTPSFELIKDVKSEQNESILELWTYVNLYAKPLNLFPTNFEVFIKSFGLEDSIYFNELFGSIMHAVCAESSKNLNDKKDAIINKPIIYDEEYIKLYSQLSKDEKMGIDQWYYWSIGKWGTGSTKFKACEVALAGALRDHLPDTHIKYVNRLLIKDESIADFFPEEEEEEEEVEVKKPAKKEEIVNHYTKTAQNGILDDIDDDFFETYGEESDYEQMENDDDSGSDFESGSYTRASRSRTNKKKKVTKPQGRKPPRDRSTAPVTVGKGTKPKSTTKKGKTFNINYLIQSAKNAFASFTISEKIDILTELIHYLQIESTVCKEHLSECVEHTIELRKQKRESERELKRLIIEKKEKLDELNASIDRMADGEEGTIETYVKPVIEETQLSDEEDDEEDDEYTGRSISRVEKLRQERLKKEAVENEVRLEREKKMVENKQKQKEIRLRNDEKKKYEDKETELEELLNDVNLQLQFYPEVSRLRQVGTDKYGNKYWFVDTAILSTLGVESLKNNLKKKDLLEWASGRLFVEVVADMESLQKKEASMIKPDSYTNPLSTYDIDSASRKGGRIGYYGTLEQVSQLINWLDKRGIRENALYKKLRDIYEDIEDEISTRNSEVEQLNKEYESNLARRTSKRGVNGTDQYEPHTDYSNKWSIV